MKVGFYLRDAGAARTSVNAIFRHRGQRFKIPTGVSVEVKKWDLSQQQATSKHPGGAAINIALSAIKTKILEEIATNPHCTVGTLKNTIRPTNGQPTANQSPVYFLDFLQQYIKNNNYAPNTLKKYQTTYNWLKKYEKHTRGRLKFENINLEFYDNFKTYILTRPYKPSKNAPIQNYTINYFGSLIKCIKKTMKESGPDSRQPLHNNTAYKSSYFKTTEEPADTIYLSIDEIMKIHRFKPTHKSIKELTKGDRGYNHERKIESIRTIKNKFIIGCFTALRVSDFNRLSEINIKGNFIRIKPKKGTRKNTDVVIPIHPIISEILASGFNLSTQVSDQKINKHIKEIARLVGINEHVEVVRTEGHKKVTRVFKKYELVTTHTARRSGATNMYLSGIPSISIMKITGHTTERSFLKYIKITAEENARLLADHPYFKNML